VAVESPEERGGAELRAHLAISTLHITRRIDGHGRVGSMHEAGFVVGF